MIINKRYLPFWLFIISLFFILIIRDLFRDGMFMDGMIYATIANNLANGLGTFWNPIFGQTIMHDFHGQPPLLFGIEAIFFKILGSSLYVERIYGLLVVLMTVFLIYKLWKCFFNERPEVNIFWLAVLFLLCIPVCFWAYSNNLEESTMGMFDLAALLFIFKSIIHKNKIWLNLSLAALMLIAASMCKGVQGLFPLTAIFFYWVIFRNISFSRMFIYSVFLLVFIIVFYGMISLNETVRSSYAAYFDSQIIPSFTNPGITHTDRFRIIKQLFSELLPVFVLMIGGGIFIKIKKMFSSIDKNTKRISLLFLLIALSGTLPLMLTLKQSGFYMVTAMPCYAIGFAIIFAPSLSTLIDQIKVNSKKLKIFTTVTWLMLAVSIVFSLITIIYIPKRDKEMLHDVYCTGEIITNGNIIGIPEETHSEWSLHAYYSRYFYISLDASSIRHKYFLLDKSLDPKLVPEGYKMLNIPTQKYNLYIWNH